MTYAQLRKRALDRCLRFRHFIRNPDEIAYPYTIAHAKRALDSERINMIKLRAMRETGGAYPADH